MVLGRVLVHPDFFISFKKNVWQLVDWVSFSQDVSESNLDTLKLVHFTVSDQVVLEKTFYQLYVT